jgi:MFS family permease
VTSSFGGWFAGALADRFGRVRVLQIAILWYSVFTFLCDYQNVALKLANWSALADRADITHR